MSHAFAFTPFSAPPIPEPRLEYQSDLHALALTAELGIGQYGDALVFGLGVQSFGTRTYADRRWLLQWNGRVELVSGLIAYEYPFRPLLGARLDGTVDSGYRLLASSNAQSSAARIAANERVGDRTDRPTARLRAGQFTNRLSLALAPAARCAWGVGGSLLAGEHSLCSSPPICTARCKRHKRSRRAWHARWRRALHVRYDIANSLHPRSATRRSPSHPRRTTQCSATARRPTNESLAGSVVKRFVSHFVLGHRRERKPRRNRRPLRRRQHLCHRRAGQRSSVAHRRGTRYRSIAGWGCLTGGLTGAVWLCAVHLHATA